MASSLLDLLNKTRGEIAAKRTKGDRPARLKAGENYLRIFPNKDDPEGPFFHPFGAHYVSTKNEKGEAVWNAYICAQDTHNKPCQLCEMVMEAKVRWKGEKAMEDVVRGVSSTQRYLINGMLSQREDFSDVEKAEMIELPLTVFEDIARIISEDVNDDVGNPIDKDNGYAFLIKRTGAGRDTKYEVSPKRKVFKGKIPDNIWDTQRNLQDYCNQADETKLAITARTIARVTGVAAPAALLTSAPAVPTGDVAALPGFGSVTGVETASVAKASDVAEKSVIDAEIARAVETEFKPETEEKPETVVVSSPSPTTSDDEDLDNLLRELDSI